MTDMTILTTFYNKSNIGIKIEIECTKSKRVQYSRNILANTIQLNNNYHFVLLYVFLF